jgi:phage terminase large subunit
MDKVREAEILIPYRPRDAFLPYHSNEKRYALTVAHRRAGKTVARINKLIKAAALCERENPRFGYLAPYYIQAKDIAWNYLKQYSAPILSVGAGKVNESELSVTFPHNNATIRLYGAENAERLRGLYFDGLAADEAQDIAPQALTQVIMPALSDRQGWLDLSGTPKGWGNLLGETYKRAQDDPEWFVQVLKASETGILSADELRRLRQMMPENEYLQEFECSFDAAITGAYYAPELQKAERENRVTRVPYDPMLRVNTAWDLGMSDSTAIWFYQQVGREIRVIDYLEAAGHGLDYYARELQNRGYLYGTHFAPHDIQVRELGTGKSRLEIAKGLGITFKALPNLPVADGISAARLTINRMYFDKVKCATGLDALRQYREKRDEKRGINLGPLHDWTSHAADSFRYLCVGIQESMPRAKSEVPRNISWMG